MAADSETTGGRVLNPAVLALICGSLLLCGITTVAVVFGLGVMIGWDPEDSGGKQLERERRAILVEAVLKLALWIELLSFFLFVSLADRIYPLLSGAMCAAGTLNANPFGYPALVAKAAAFGLCGLWLIVNRAGGPAVAVGIVRFKQAFLVVIWGTLLVECGLQFKFFSSLEPDILTSCCATIF